MIQIFARVTSVRQAAPNILVLSFHAPELATRITPGQFINIKVNDFNVPLLRRPFSVYHVEGNELSVIFNVVGLGTSILSQKKGGDLLDIIGPLGKPYDLQSDFQTALLVEIGRAHV